MSEITYNYTCSLGSLCHSSQLLKRNEIKICSYPFDWVFSGLEMIMHCLEDDFRVFLDKSYYVDIQNRWNNNQCGHKYYHLNLFNHFDPRNEKDYNYYIRCVDRFRSLLLQEDYKLFTMMFININLDKANETIINDLVNFNNKFSKYTTNYTLLVILHMPDKKKNYHNFIYIDNIHILELHTVSKSGGVEFGDNNDNIYLDNIIKSSYNINLKK